MSYRIKQTYQGRSHYVAVAGKSEWPNLRDAWKWFPLVKQEFKHEDPEAELQLVILDGEDEYVINLEEIEALES